MGSAMSGGDFWRGAAIGGIVAGANHVLHSWQTKLTLKKMAIMYRLSKNMYEHYSGESVNFYMEAIGGELGEMASVDPDLYVNKCAAVLSYALNYSGFEIPDGTPNTFKGADGKNYFKGAALMFQYLKKSHVLGTPKSGTDFSNAIFFQSGFGGGVTGHIDIMYKGVPAGNFYSYPNLTTQYW